MASLTSRERVKRAFSRREPDRVPINYFSNPALDRRLKEHFGLGPDDAEGLRRALGVDFRGIGAPYRGPKLHPDVPDRTVDNWGVHRRWIAHPAGGYWDYCDFPLRGATVDQVARWPMPSPDDYDYSTIPAQCARYGDFHIHVGGAGTGDIINHTGFLFSQEQVLINLIDEDEACLLYIDRRLAVDLEVTKRTLEAARGRVDMLWIGEDLGTQIGPLISRDLFRRILRPRHQRLVDLAKAFHIPMIIHSCGSSSWAFDDFIEMGISIVDTLQPEAKDMAPAYLKKRYGKDLAFHGCISTAGPVSFGTVEQVREEVRQTLAVMKPGGGYALAPTHSLQDNSPTENVVAMYAAAQEYGRYA